MSHERSRSPLLTFIGVSALALSIAALFYWGIFLLGCYIARLCK